MAKAQILWCVCFEKSLDSMSGDIYDSASRVRPSQTQSTDQCVQAHERERNRTLDVTEVSHVETFQSQSHSHLLPNACMTSLTASILDLFLSRTECIVNLTCTFPSAPHQSCSRVSDYIHVIFISSYFERCDRQSVT